MAPKVYGASYRAPPHRGRKPATLASRAAKDPEHRRPTLLAINAALILRGHRPRCRSSHKSCRVERSSHPPSLAATRGLIRRKDEERGYVRPWFVTSRVAPEHCDVVAKRNVSSSRSSLLYYILLACSICNTTICDRSKETPKFSYHKRLFFQIQTTTLASVFSKRRKCPIICITTSTDATFF
jgi:hypothetical protein